MKKFISTFLLTILFSSNIFAQSFNAKVNRSEVPAGEIFVLSLQYLGDDKNNPDFSILEKNFTVYSQSYSTSSYLSENALNTVRNWEISLIPNQTDGEATVPAIKLGKSTSKPISIRIKTTQDANISSNSGYQEVQDSPKYSINIKVDNDSPFVQQQILYSIIIEDTGSLQISEPTFGNNINDDWSVRYLGYPIVRNKDVNGQTIREIIFNYAIFPQKSGSLELPEARINGYYITQQKGTGRNVSNDVFNRIMQDDFGDIRNIFSDMLVVKNPIILRTKPTSIEVRANPDIQNINWWLPAKDVQISAIWDTPSANFKIGEAISRRIQIKAVGTIDSQLPNVKFGNIDGVKQYPEKPILSSAVDGTNVVSAAEISNVYIPSRTGDITIPAVNIHWFNTSTGKSEISTLAETTIQIHQNKNYTPVKNQELDTVNNELQQELSIANDTTKKTLSINIYILIIIAFITGIFFSKFIFEPKKEPHPKEIKTSRVNYKNNVIIAAQDNDFKMLSNNLICWARERFHDDKISNLADINKYTSNKEFAKFIENISAKLFSDDANIIWNNQEFIKAFEKMHHNKLTSTKNKTSALPKLYKD